MLLLLIAIPTAESKNANIKEEENDFFKIFFKCYVEIEYFGEFTPKDTYNIRGIGLRFYNNKEGEITVYTEENGDILWQNKGIHRLRILYLDGSVKTAENIKTTYGQAILLRAISI
jgi:hypothetical protein